MVKRKQLMQKKFPLSCNHNTDYLKDKDLKDRLSTQSKCSQVARTGCKICILHYVYTVYQKAPSVIEKAKVFVSECVCFNAETKGRSVDQVFELLQLCHFAGLGFAFEIFEFEDRYTKPQLIWLFEHGASPRYMSLKSLIAKEAWDIVLLAASKLTDEKWTASCEIIHCLKWHVCSPLLALILFYFLDGLCM